MKYELLQEFFDGIREICIDTKKNNEEMTVTAMLMRLMNMENLPMHCPYHHFLVPAAMLTQAAVIENISDDELNAWLDIAEERAKNVPGGFCGECGACGSGISMGIFVSVYTGATPKTVENWQWANEATGIALQKISEYPGPRCCKRTAFLAINGTVGYINEKCGTKLRVDDNIVCTYYDRNAECIESQCPFYMTESEIKSERFAIIVEPEMMPKKDPKRTCKCMNEPVKLATKKGILTWIKEVGDQVKAGEVICEGEVEKKILEFTAPYDGILIEKCINDQQVFTAGSVLGYIGAR